MSDVLVGKRSQVVIPADVRRRLGITEGDRLHIDVDERGRIILERLPEDPTDRLLQVGRSLYTDVDAVQWQRGLRQEWDR